MKWLNISAVVKASSLLIIPIFLFSSQVFSQEYQKENKEKKNPESLSKRIDSKTLTDSSIIRKGTIDLAAIDENKDGKVFQDEMDWNVISDRPDKCPVCKMKLKEVTLTVAKENLVKNKFKVK